MMNATMPLLGPRYRCAFSPPCCSPPGPCQRRCRRRPRPRHRRPAGATNATAWRPGPRANASANKTSAKVQAASANKVNDDGLSGQLLSIALDAPLAAAAAAAKDWYFTRTRRAPRASAWGKRVGHPLQKEEGRTGTLLQRRTPRTQTPATRRRRTAATCRNGRRGRPKSSGPRGPHGPRRGTSGARRRRACGSC